MDVVKFYPFYLTYLYYNNIKYKKELQISPTKLIVSLIEDIQEETSMSYDDSKDLLSLLFEKMKNCNNNTLVEAICMELS